MAFGTGDHSTTKLICQMLENCVKRDSFWIDIGTGTGILSILAIMLGAKKVIAIDNDNWAIENAKENLMVNKLSDKVELIFGDVLNLDLPKATGICANLSISLIQKCWNKFHLSLVDNNGDLIISGILIYDKEKIITEARKIGFKLINFIIDEEWIAFNFKVRD
jgi:ribosomal protein L11 methyltransferase